MDYYEILGIQKNASHDEIKKKYRSLSFQYHPDRNPTEIEKYKKINEAYEILGDEMKRKEYDMGSIDPLQNIFENFMSKQKKKEDPIEELFKNQEGFLYSFMNQNNVIETIDVIIEIGFKDAYNGIKQPINIKRQIINGQSTNYEIEKIYVDIPRGVDDDEIIKIKENGHCHNGVYGDIKIKIKIISNEYFERKGLDLIYRKNITFKESICGFEYKLTHLNNNVMKLKSSPGNVIQNYDEKIIEHKGFMRDNKMGNLIIMFKVEPQYLNEKQLKILNELL